MLFISNNLFARGEILFHLGLRYKLFYFGLKSFNLWRMKFIIFILLAVPTLVLAQAQVFPTRLTLTEETPSTYLTLKNPSGKTQKFKVEILELAMKKDGGVIPAKGQHNELIEGLKYSPKTVEIQPNDKQIVRVMMTSFDSLPDGENHVYLHFIPVGDNEAKSEAKLSLQARIAVAVPVIVRRGSPRLDLKMKSPSAISDKKGNLKVSFEVTNTTKYYVTGDLEVFAVTPKGEISLSKVLSISSYIPSRIVTVDIPKESLIEKAGSEDVTKFKVKYASNEDSAAPFELVSEVLTKAPAPASKKSANKRR